MRKLFTFAIICIINLFQSELINAQNIQMVLEIRPTYLGATIEHAINYNGLAYFSADDGTNGQEVWVSDGTPGGTNMLKNLNAGGSSVPADFTIYNNKLYFTANAGNSTGRELYVTDGTSNGTYMVKDINPGIGNSDPEYLTVANGKLYFNAYTATYNREPWISDGTLGGTMMLKDIFSNFGSSNPKNFTEYNGNVYFNAVGDLYVTDGTTGGTSLFYDTYTGPDHGDPANLIAFNNELYFVSGDSAHGRELWKTDGTIPNTNLFMDIIPGDYSSDPNTFFIFNGMLFFSGRDSVTHGYEPWKSDGTLNGTNMVKDINPGFANSNPDQFIIYNNQLYFTAEDGVGTTNHGRELWVTDGTEPGTNLVMDIYTGYGSANPNSLVLHDGKIFMSAADSASIYQLWMTDGTIPGTQKLMPSGSPLGGALYCSPGNIVSIGSVLLFPALYDINIGCELHRYEGTTSVNEIENSVERLNVYPNPVSDKCRFSFSLDHASNVSIELADIAGKRIVLIEENKFNSGLHEIDYNFSEKNIGDGIYFLNLIVDGNKREVKKLEVIR